MSPPAKYADPRAHALRARYHASFEAPELPVPVESIAEDLLGLRVQVAPMSGISGFLYPAERVVFLNAADSPQRRRFTLAHELGHWICQHLEGTRQPLYCRHEDVTAAAPPDRAREREANVFAAELLMPEPAVRGAWNGNATVASAAFGVSAEAMHWRAYSFGLVSVPPAPAAAPAAARRT